MHRRIGIIIFVQKVIATWEEQNDIRQHADELAAPRIALDDGVGSGLRAERAVAIVRPAHVSSSASSQGLLCWRSKSMRPVRAATAGLVAMRRGLRGRN